jgi:hypothetical protein
MRFPCLLFKVEFARSPLERPATIVDSTQPHPDLAALTDSDGGFEFSDLSPGWYCIQVLDEHREVVLTSDSEVIEVIFEIPSST